jgi:glycerate kinase
MATTGTLCLRAAAATPAVFAHGIDGLEAATAAPMSLDEAMAKARENLQNAGERIARLIVVGQRMGR